MKIDSTLQIRDKVQDLKNEGRNFFSLIIVSQKSPI